MWDYIPHRAHYSGAHQRLLRSDEHLDVCLRSEWKGQRGRWTEANLKVFWSQSNFNLISYIHHGRLTSDDDGSAFICNCLGCLINMPNRQRPSSL